MLALLATGCGESYPETYPVTGVVTHKGKPVEGADVVLVPSDEKLRSAGGMTDADGKFSVTTYFDPEHQSEGAMPGDYGVTVSKTEVLEAPPGLKPEEIMAYHMKHGTPKPQLPTKYAAAKTSGFNVTVTADSETPPLKLDLQ
jgi:hypothetical protein